MTTRFRRKLSCLAPLWHTRTCCTWAQDGCKATFPQGWRCSLRPRCPLKLQERDPGAREGHRATSSLAGKKGGGDGESYRRRIFVSGRFFRQMLLMIWGRSNETWMARVNYIEDENVFDYNKNLDLSSLLAFFPQSRKTRFKLTRSHSTMNAQSNDEGPRELPF